MESNSIYLAEYEKLQLDMIDTIREGFKKNLKYNMITFLGGWSLRVNDYFLFFCSLCPKNHIKTLKFFHV